MITPTLCLVVPCYNEQETLSWTNTILLEELEKLKKNEIINNNSFVVYINDGSTDNTLNVLQTFNNEFVKYLNLETNKGQDYSILKGLKDFQDKADIFISLDADLQDDISVLSEFIAEYKKGNNIVYGIKTNREVDSFFKRYTAYLYYYIIKKFRPNTISNHSNYRLLTKDIILLIPLDEKIILRTYIPNIGIPYSCVYHNRLERKYGTTKYSVLKMMKLSIISIIYKNKKRV